MTDMKSCSLDRRGSISRANGGALEGIRTADPIWLHCFVELICFSRPQANGLCTRYRGSRPVAEYGG
jgi:hypothetical protein